MARLSLALGATARHRYSRLVEEVLDRLAVTDREYHHLHFDAPLVAELVERIDAHAGAGARVLVIGGNTLLAEVLIQLRLDVELWSFPQTHLTETIRPRVTREVTPERLADCVDSEGAYDVIVLPLVLESLPRDELAVLRALRRSLRPDGRLIVATRNQSRLSNRFRMLTGRPFSLRHQAEPRSLSWPALDTVHEYHQDELVALAQRAGLRTLGLNGVQGTRAFRDIDLLPMGAYVRRKLMRLGQALLPSGREVLVAEFSRRPGDVVIQQEPTVVVSLAVTGEGDSVAALRAVSAQSFPAERLSVVVAHSGPLPGALEEELRRTEASTRIRTLEVDGIDGPRARNAVLHACDADIVAATDDLCAVPPDWVEAGVRQLDDDTAIASGPVYALAGSHPKYLDLPGLRPDQEWREPLRTDLFPAYNSFQRREAVVAVGGFDAAFEEGGAVRVGWDADLAWRLQRSGWQAVFRHELAVGRCFPPPEGLRAQVRRAEGLPALYAALPEMRGEMASGVFASRETRNFDLMLLGVGCTVLRRQRRWLLFAVPWTGQLRGRIGVRPSHLVPSIRTVGRITIAHGAWLVGLIRGSIRSRRLVL